MEDNLIIIDEKQLRFNIDKSDPVLAKEIAKPLGNIDKITVVDSSGNGASGGASKVSKYVTDLMATMPDMVKDVSDVDIKKIIRSLTDDTGDRVEEEEDVSA